MTGEKFWSAEALGVRRDGEAARCEDCRRAEREAAGELDPDCGCDDDEYPARRSNRWDPGCGTAHYGGRCTY
jgi:hypothetical protein